MIRLCIAHGGDVSDPSGGTDRVSALASGLSERGHDVTLVVPELDGEPQHDLDGVDVREVSLPSAVENSVSSAGAIARRAKAIADERGATLQYEHSIMAGLGTLVGASSYVLDMHDLAYSRYDHVDSAAASVMQRGVAWLERRAVRKADRIIAVSEYMADQLQSEWGVPASKLSVVPNGYFPEKLAPFADIDVVDGRVCFLGTLHPKVDVGTIEAVCQLDSVTETVVIGDGAQRDRLESLAAEYKSLEVTGRLPDVEAFKSLASAAVAINPQHRSALQRSSSPVKLYYYAALGKPMVVTAGPPLVADLAEAGAAVVVEDQEEFVERVEAVVNDERFATELGENALAEAEAFRWSSRVDSIERIHE